jgi:hypothetical protein
VPLLKSPGTRLLASALLLRPLRPGGRGHQSAGPRLSPCRPNRGPANRGPQSALGPQARRGRRCASCAKTAFPSSC